MPVYQLHSGWASSGKFICILNVTSSKAGKEGGPRGKEWDNESEKEREKKRESFSTSLYRRMNIIFSRPRRAGAREFRLANDIALVHATYLNCLITLTLFSVSVSGLNDSRSSLELRDVKQRNGRKERENTVQFWKKNEMFTFLYLNLYCAFFFFTIISESISIILKRLQLFSIPNSPTFPIKRYGLYNHIWNKALRQKRSKVDNKINKIQVEVKTQN